MKYAKLKRGKSYRSGNYFFRKGIWVEIATADVEYFATNCSDRIEFAPAGITPKNDVLKINNTDGIISIDGSGKDGMIVSKKEKLSEVDEELAEEEKSEILRIREKYRRKAEKKSKDKEEKKNKDKEEKKIKKQKEKEDKKKMDDVQDISNPIYIKKKQSAKGDVSGL